MKLLGNYLVYLVNYRKTIRVQIEFDYKIDLFLYFVEVMEIENFTRSILFAIKRLFCFVLFSIEM